MVVVVVTVRQDFLRLAPTLSGGWALVPGLGDSSLERDRDIDCGVREARLPAASSRPDRGDQHKQEVRKDVRVEQQQRS